MFTFKMISFYQNDQIEACLWTKGVLVEQIKYSGGN